MTALLLCTSFVSCAYKDTHVKIIDENTLLYLDVETEVTSLLHTLRVFEDGYDFADLKAEVTRKGDHR